MARPVPAGIVAAASALAEELADWCVHGREQPLAAHEQAVLGGVRRALPRLPGAVVRASTGGLGRRGQPEAACPGCGRPVAPLGRRGDGTC